VTSYAEGFPVPLQIRIGIHTGTVVAGIVGKKKFSYDLWGEVVNEASRYQSTGTPNRVHVSEAVHMRLADDFDFEDGGTVHLNGKGSAPSWFLLCNKRIPSEVIELHARRAKAE
jgi:adenylate cyclase